MRGFWNVDASMVLGLLECPYDATSRVFSIQYAKKDWQQHLRSGAHADAIMERIVHNTTSDLLYGFRIPALLVLTKFEGHAESEVE